MERVDGRGMDLQHKDSAQVGQGGTPSPMLVHADGSLKASMQEVDRLLHMSLWAFQEAYGQYVNPTHYSCRPTGERLYTRMLYTRMQHMDKGTFIGLDWWEVQELLILPPPPPVPPPRLDLAAEFLQLLEEQGTWP